MEESNEEKAKQVGLTIEKDRIIVSQDVKHIIITTNENGIALLQGNMKHHEVLGCLEVAIEETKFEIRDNIHQRKVNGVISKFVKGIKDKETIDKLPPGGKA